VAIDIVIQGTRESRARAIDRFTNGLRRVRLSPASPSGLCCEVASGIALCTPIL
jgi:hypothetical protein